MWYVFQAVYEAMWELKSHEYIENHYIMDKLKARLQAKRVYNQLVCNCHEDSKLLGVIRLVEKVYGAETHEEREEQGAKLRKAIEGFLDEFLHHMEEEEEIFQPLLNENFEARELHDMNETVKQQHDLFRKKVKEEKSLKMAVKRKIQEDEEEEENEEFASFSLEDLRFRKSYCQEVKEQMEVKKAKIDDDVSNNNPSISNSNNDTSTVMSLPEEVWLQILHKMDSPRDLLKMASIRNSLFQAHFFLKAL